jgi:hypothetical protein
VARTAYGNRQGNSGVRAYSAGPDFIRVWFADGEGYEYNNDAPGCMHVEAMKRLAQEGRGLATYINRHVREHDARKL